MKLHAGIISVLGCTGSCWVRVRISYIENRWDLYASTVCIIKYAPIRKFYPACINKYAPVWKLSPFFSALVYIIYGLRCFSSSIQDVFHHFQYLGHVPIPQRVEPHKNGICALNYRFALELHLHLYLENKPQITHALIDYNFGFIKLSRNHRMISHNKFCSETVNNFFSLNRLFSKRNKTATHRFLDNIRKC